MVSQADNNRINGRKFNYKYANNGKGIMCGTFNFLQQHVYVTLCLNMMYINKNLYM